MTAKPKAKVIVRYTTKKDHEDRLRKAIYESLEIDKTTNYLQNAVIALSLTVAIVSAYIAIG